MNIVKKEWAYSHYDMQWAKQELAEYEFDGRIDFTMGPIFLYDDKNCIVVDYEDTGRKEAVKVLIDDVVVDYKNGYTETGIAALFKAVKVDRFRLSKNYGLQDFFNEHKKAKCIVFFIYTNSIFHDGYTIRVFIDEEISEKYDEHQI